MLSFSGPAQGDGRPDQEALFDPKTRKELSSDPEIVDLMNRCDIDAEQVGAVFPCDIDAILAFSA